ncbi:hypothetical protein P43SY_011310 [Pythium insidiosum]|uniref:Uncharacterized protein n=1 Tax=Pythium insidiosum TaxID=114742 RepID=A0AAD5L599_PYTIN|nr:hypothetical protein P43SY_011310 [Pythium insidiosum]
MTSMPLASSSVERSAAPATATARRMPVAAAADVHELTPLVAAREQAPELGTPRFPFHPESPSTPWWRKLFFELYDVSGGSSPIQLSDVPTLPRSMQSAVVSEELRRLFLTSRRRLLPALWEMNKSAMLRSAALQLAATALVALYPLLLFRLLHTVVTVQGYELSGVIAQLMLLFGTQLLQSLFVRHAFYHANTVAIRTTGSLYALVVDECIRHGHRQLSDSESSANSDRSGRHKQRLAEVAVVYNEDVENVGRFMVTINLMWASSLELIAEIVILVHIVEGRTYPRNGEKS